MTWTHQRHQAAKERCEKATPGSWHAGVRGLSIGGISFIPVAVGSPQRTVNTDDLKFIAGARFDLPDALAEIERLQGVTEGHERLLRVVLTESERACYCRAEAHLGANSQCLRCQIEEVLG